MRALINLSIAMLVTALCIAGCGGGSGGQMVIGGGGGSSSSISSSSSGNSSSSGSSSSSSSSSTSSSSGSSSSSSASCLASGTNTGTANIATVVVDGGPACAYSQGQGQVNILYVTVVICAPGSTTNCQAIDHVQVDTGSYGLRILSQALQPSLASALPVVNETQTGQPLVECTAFADGYSWGPIRAADMQIAGEKASSLEVQIIGDPAYATVPSDCSSNGNQEDTVAQFGANGILGVGPFVPDCGTACAPGAAGGVATGVYYVCSSPATCNDSAPAFKGVALTQQVGNPVASFAKDNNGVIINLAAVPQGGAANPQGQLIFGIDTETNNVMAAANVLPTDHVNGYITTVFPLGGTTYPNSYIDSGSNAYYFIDNLTQCTTNTGFYCPGSELTLSAQNQGYQGTPTSNVTFYVGYADNLSISNTAFDDLAGCPVSSTSSTCPSTSKSFDWGLPFFFGQPVYTVIACQQDGATCATTTKGYGPYIAY